MLLRCKIKPYIQPFERKLALEELTSLTGCIPRQVCSDNGSLLFELDTKISDSRSLLFEIDTKIEVSTLQQRLAYWESVIDTKAHLTVQSLREASINLVRNGVTVEQIPELVNSRLHLSLPNRRALRYASHGLHEYRGKFFPQLVRALLNMADVPQGGLVADPMSGSGTTVVESVLSGYRGLGADINPLSVFMSRTKCAILSTLPGELTATYHNVRNKLTSNSSARNGQPAYLQSLPSADQHYLRKWFSDQVLSDLDQIAIVIQALATGPIRDFMWLCMSNIIRSVSWQKDVDLRVRKEVRLDVDIDPIKEFLEELGRCVRAVLAFLYQNRGMRLGSFDITEGNACHLQTTWHSWLGQCDVVITSPPYATALPYIDTDRLSLCYLGLLHRPEHRRRELEMIGNREITERVRENYMGMLQDNSSFLPTSVLELIKQIGNLNSKANVGFRRHNLPALLAKYFFDMRSVFSGIAAMLKPGRPAYVVIGNNHTIAGGQRVEIQTANLLAEIAAGFGLVLEQEIPMEMLLSRDIFKQNAVASEVILCLRSLPSNSPTALENF